MKETKIYFILTLFYHFSIFYFPTFLSFLLFLSSHFFYPLQISYVTWHNVRHFSIVKIDFYFRLQYITQIIYLFIYFLEFQPMTSVYDDCVFYHKTNIPIDFLCRRRLNLKSLIQSSKILAVELTRTHISQILRCNLHCKIHMID